MLVFGYPTKQQIERVKPKRVNVKHIVHANGYRQMDKEELQEMFSSKAGIRPYEDYMKAFCERKYNSDFSKEMTRSVAEFMKDYDGVYQPCHSGIPAGTPGDHGAGERLSCYRQLRRVFQLA